MHQGNNDKVNSNNMAGVAQNSPGVEDLMKTKDHWPGIGLAKHIDYSSAYIADSTSNNQPYYGRSSIGGQPEEPEEGYSGHAKYDVCAGIKPAGSINPNDMNYQSYGSENPHGGNNYVSHATAQGKRYGSVSAGNEEENVHVINPPQDPGYFGRPVTHMVNSRVGKKNEGTSHENSASPLEAGRGSQTDKNNSGCQGQGSGDQVNPTSEQGFRSPMNIETDFFLITSPCLLLNDAGLVFTFCQDPVGLGSRLHPDGISLGLLVGDVCPYHLLHCLVAHFRIIC